MLGARSLARLLSVPSPKAPYGSYNLLGLQRLLFTASVGHLVSELEFCEFLPPQLLP